MTIGISAFVVSLLTVAQLAAQPAERPRSKAWTDPEGDMIDRLQAVAGASLAPCARITTEDPPLTRATLKLATECVSKSAAARQPAIAIIHLRGMDSWIAYGLVSTVGGELHWFHYDSDVTGGGDVPWLTEGRCERLRLRKRRGVGQTFSCST